MPESKEYLFHDPDHAEPDHTAYPLTLEVKDEKALDKVVKALAAEAAAGFLAELQAQSKLALPKMGSFKVSKDGVGDDGSLTASFKPTKPTKKKVE